MEERVREPEERRHKAQPIGCPWQLLCYATHTMECRLQIAQRSPDVRCQPNCDVYTHLQTLNAQIKKLQEELHDAKCAANAKSTVA